MSAEFILSPQASELLATAIERSDSQSAILFLCDTTAPAMRLHRLHQQGLSPEAVEYYSRGNVHSHDPFLTAPVTRRGTSKGGAIVIDASDRELHRNPMAEEYWAFLSRFQIGVTGAVIKPISSTMVLVGRLYRDALCRGARITSVAEDMGSLLDAVASQMMAIATRSMMLDHAPAQDYRDCQIDLTPRQHRVVRLLRAGLLNKQIAHELTVPEHTVENDLRQVYRKLGVRNRVGLVEQLSD